MPLHGPRLDSPAHAGCRVVVASNRLPVVVDREEGGPWRVRPGSGGLVAALLPVLEDRGGVWVGWPGTTAERPEGLAGALASAHQGAGYTLAPVLLSARERKDFYEGCANEVIWPLFHDLSWQIHVEPSFWKAYVAVNRKYARAIAARAAPEDLVWVHDYHLMLVGQALREAGVTSRTGFFLHIPFPPLDVFLRLPWRLAVLEGLLHYDVVGFQTDRDRRNFVECVRELVRGCPVSDRGRRVMVRRAGRTVRLGAFPIGVDFGALAAAAGAPEIDHRVHATRGDLPGQQVLLGVDRLDYTKGIPRRLRAFRHYLETHPEARGRVTLVQVVVPSRVGVRKYRELKRDIEHLVSSVNGEYTHPGWVPVHYMYRSVDPAELLTLYRAADVALVTPLKDGMNLVAKEYCASRTDGGGVLVLSEFAGAAEQLRGGALLVNPYDVEGVAAAIHRAVTMSTAERRRRMHALRRNVQQGDVFAWVDAFLRAAVPAATEGPSRPNPEVYAGGPPAALSAGR